MENFKEVKVVSLDELKKASGEIISFAEDIKIWTFEGDIGAGKTTLIKALCDDLGVTDPVSSPTYSIVNEYICKDASKIFHFDFYRIKSEMEALDIGFEEYADSGELCLIEWPSQIKNLLPFPLLNVHIEIFDNQRKISLSRLYES